MCIVNKVYRLCVYQSKRRTEIYATLIASTHSFTLIFTRSVKSFIALQRWAWDIEPIDVLSILHIDICKIFDYTYIYMIRRVWGLGGVFFGGGVNHYLFRKESICINVFAWTKEMDKTMYIFYYKNQVFWP